MINGQESRLINTAALIRLARGVLPLLKGTGEADRALSWVKELPFRARESGRLINIVLVKVGN